MRENAATKGRRLLVEGRVCIVVAGGEQILARVHGDEAALYAVTYSPDGWACTCPAGRRRFHVRAVQLVSFVVKRCPSEQPPSRGRGVSIAGADQRATWS